MCVSFFFFFFFFSRGLGCLPAPGYIGRQKFVSILTSIGAGKKSQVRARSRHVRDL